MRPYNTAGRKRTDSSFCAACAEVENQCARVKLVLLACVPVAGWYHSPWRSKSQRCGPVRTSERRGQGRVRRRGRRTVGLFEEALHPGAGQVRRRTVPPLHLCRRSRPRFGFPELVGGPRPIREVGRPTRDGHRPMVKAGSRGRAMCVTGVLTCSLYIPKHSIRFFCPRSHMERRKGRH